MAPGVCSRNDGGGRRGGGKDTGCLEDRETKKCQKEVESKGQTRQTKIDGASGSTKVLSHHAGKQKGNNRVKHFKSKQTVEPCQTLQMMKDFLLIAFHKIRKKSDKKITLTLK